LGYIPFGDAHGRGNGEERALQVRVFVEVRAVRLEVSGKRVAAGEEADLCGMTTRKAKASATANANANTNANTNTNTNTGVSPLRITKTKA
jgi:hypothetical protein